MGNRVLKDGTTATKGQLRWPAQGLLTMLIGIVAALVLIGVLTFFLEPNSRAAMFLLDRHRHSIFPYPFTIQNLSYVITAIGLIDLFNRWRSARYERALVNAHLLPEGDESILELSDLGPNEAGSYCLKNLINRIYLESPTDRLAASSGVRSTVP
jgi:hypothetical protein